MNGRRGVAAVVAQTGLVAVVLGAVMGLVWWWVAPTGQWIVVDGGLAPADIGFTAWFAADAWFLVLGAVAGVLLAAISWRPGRHRPLALVVGVIVGAALIALVAWALGGALGAPDPQALATTADPGTMLQGALGIRAIGVVFGPALTSLTVLALLLSNARLDENGGRGSSPAADAGVPQQIW